jgi:hypothetical protein
MKKYLLSMSLFALLFISTNNVYAGTLDPFSYSADSYVEGKTTTYTFTYTTETEILTSEAGGEMIFRAELGPSDGINIPAPLNGSVTIDGVSTIPLEISGGSYPYIRLGIDVPAGSEVVVVLSGIVNRSAGTYDWTNEIFTANGGSNPIDSPASIDDLVITEDTTDPTIENLSPIDDGVDILVNTDLVITFDEIVAVDSGDIHIYKTSDSSLVETIDSTSGKVTGSGTDTIIINPTDNLESETEYYVLIDSNVFDDNFGNSFDGISANNTWNFTTADAPSVTAVTPSNGATNINPDVSLVVIFSEEMDTENLPLISSAPCNFDGACATQSGAFDENGTEFTITIPETLVSGIEYTFYLSEGLSETAGAIMDDFEFSFTIKEERRTSGARRYGCKDTLATNYERFSSHRQSLCEYEINSPVVPITTTVAPQAAQTEPISTKAIFTIDLELGAVHPDVVELQKFLNNNGFTVSVSGPGSLEKETNYFGSLTRAALIKFQDANSEAILSPVGLTKGTGYFGKSTISFISSL